uniref:PH domain-containing protein n=1 Tax=Strongyloides venezuelensis TaxID=75913 RepID=A0A0K0FTL3_STRVS
MDNWFLSIKNVAQNALNENLPFSSVRGDVFVNQESSLSSPLPTTFQPLISQTPFESCSESDYTESSLESEDFNDNFYESTKPMKKNCGEKYSKIAASYHLKGLKLQKCSGKNPNRREVNIKTNTVKNNELYHRIIKSRSHPLVFRPERPIYISMQSNKFYNENKMGFPTLPAPRKSKISFRKDLATLPIPRKTKMIGVKNFGTLQIPRTNRIDRDNCKVISVLQAKDSNKANEFTGKSKLSKDGREILYKGDNSKEIIPNKSLIETPKHKKEDSNIIIQERSSNLNGESNNIGKYSQYCSNPLMLKKNSSVISRNTIDSSRQRKNGSTNDVNLIPLNVVKHFVKDRELYYVLEYSKGIKRSIPLEKCVGDKKLVDLIFKYNNSKKSLSLFKRKNASSV